MINAIGYAAKSSSGKLAPFEFTRKEPTANEVQIDILFCGVCHSDVHQAKNEWHNTMYPCLPGHEIVGRVVKVGDQVKKFKVGDIAGVGCMVDSCKKCENCKKGLENYCLEGFTATYNGNMRHPKKEENTFGGYSSAIVVREDFVLRIPPNIKPEDAASLLCAGVTTFSPLRYWNVEKGKKIGVIGLGGLGHVATKLAVAMGAEVTVITTNPEKRSRALDLGAKNVIVSDNENEMKAAEGTLDLILSTVPESHDANPYLTLLKTSGVLSMVGCLVPLKKPIDMSHMNSDRKTLSSTLIGGIKETQDVLDFCAQNGVRPDIELIEIEKINDAFDDLDAKKADFRYVIDMSTIKNKKEDHSLLHKIGLN